MTDNDIIKALECCAKGTTSTVCLDCPLRFSDICTEEENGVVKLALDLINRQKAEIERLRKGNNFKKVQIDGFKKLLKRADTIKAEAVKEFSHFLIDKAEDGVISVAELPDLVVGFGEGG